MESDSPVSEIDNVAFSLVEEVSYGIKLLKSTNRNSSVISDDVYDI